MKSVRAVEGPMRILLATDGSHDAADALEWLIHFPLPAAAAVDVVSVVPQPVFDEGIGGTAWRELREQTESVVEDARQRLAKRWPAVIGTVLEGDARQAILDAAERGRSDLVVLGARGLGAVASFLLGSVSLGVARHARCSVLVCKGVPRPVRAVTIGLDGSDDARSALRMLSELPLPSAVALRLVGAVEPLRYPASAPGIMAARLRAALKDYEEERRRELATVLAAGAADVRARVGTIVTATPVGSAAESLLRDAEQHDSDLIVVGARGLGALKRLVLGSVSESVLRHATCPVLIVHAPK